MKKILLVVLPLLMILLSACGEKVPTVPVETTFSVQGMTCQNCVDGITGAVNKLPGVESCVVDLAAATAVVTIIPKKFPPSKSKSASINSDLKPPCPPLNNRGWPV